MSVVSSFPAPPSHYKRFKQDEDVEGIPPPSIPQSIPPIFGEGLSHLPPLREFDESLDYRTELKTLFERMREELSNLTSHPLSRKGDENASKEMKEVTSEFYGRLGELREHQAREELCDELRRDVEEKRKLLQSIQQCKQEIGLLSQTTTDIKEKEEKSKMIKSKKKRKRGK